MTTRYETLKNNLKTEEMVINMGPQHPSTHGVLRLELITNGEVVNECIPHIGYLHRCFEKHAEALTHPQLIPYTDRRDYLAAMTNLHVFAIGVAPMLGIASRSPHRLQYVPLLLPEMNRIASHLIAVGTYGIATGAVTPYLWCFRDRELIMTLLGWASGA